MKAPRVIVVEDEAHLAAGLKLNLELEGFEVTTAPSARDASAQLVGPKPYDVMVLDVMLPDMTGFELCKKLRESGNRIPIIMLTARDKPTDRVRGLELGADDYLGKPFEMKELLARMRSLLRRRGWEAKPNGGDSTYHFGDTELNFATHVVTVRGKAIELTKLELDLVRYFAQNPGRVLSREELLEKVWKLGHYPNTRTVDNFVARLRKHFDDPDEPRHFFSIRGAGYKFEP